MGKILIFVLNSKHETRNSKQIIMTEIINHKQYDLEDRTLKFAKRVRTFTNNLPRSLNNLQDCPQLVRASGSVGANYIEANESLSKKDFIMRIKISRKEAKESVFWLKLVDTNDKQELELEKKGLINEATELMKIFSSIMRKCE